MVKKIIINNEKVINLPDVCKFDVIDNKLFNLNTKMFEGVDGDIVVYEEYGNSYIDEISSYTLGQVINGKFYGSKILSCDKLPVKITHRSIVEAYD